MSRKLKVIFIEDNENDLMLMLREMQLAGYEVTHKQIQTSDHFQQALEGEHWDLIICDYILPHFNGNVALELYKSMQLEIPFIIVSGLIGEDRAVNMIKSGAHDYVLKNNLTRFIPSVERALQEFQLKNQHHREEILRKMAEIEIRKLSRAVEQSPVIIVMTDANGDIEYVNPKLSEITGYSSEEVIGQNPRILKTGETSREIYIELWKTIKSGNEWHGEFHNKKKNGELYWESASISSIKDDNGEVVSYLAVKEDITERKIIQQDLITAKEKAEESSRLKASLLSNMSHELRTPMNAIIGFADFLMQENLTESQKDMVSSITISAQRLISTITSILDLSMLESESVVPKLKTIELGEILPAIIKTHKSHADKNNLKLRFESIPAGYQINVDERIFTRILDNLIDNAIKYTEKGEINVSHRKERTDGKEWIILSIKDTGIGIAPENLKLIFDEFRQVSEGYGRNFEGVGLGLSLAYKSAFLLGGKLEVESTPGTGSIFSLKLPAAVEKIDTAPDEIPGTSNHQTNNDYLTKQILVVEDNPFNSEVIRNYLRECHSITYTRDGVMAIHLATQRHFDLILMDINLGIGLNGVDTAHRIRMLPGYEKIPVVAVTGYAMVGDKEALLDKGFNDYISKPFTKEDILDVVQKWAK
jgi:PAS domain S-box-containing protein